MSLESLDLREYGVCVSDSELDSDEELDIAAEKCISLFASLLTDDSCSSTVPAQETTGISCGEGLLKTTAGERGGGESSHLVEQEAQSAVSRGDPSFTSIAAENPTMQGVMNANGAHSDGGHLAGGAPALVIRPGTAASPAAVGNCSGNGTPSGVPISSFAGSEPSFSYAASHSLASRIPIASANADLCVAAPGPVVVDPASAAVRPPLPTTAAAASSSAAEGGVFVRQRPAVPPKPQIDIVRYSMANAKDDLDLDTILSELLELENQLSGEGGDHLLLGLPTLPKSTSQDAIRQHSVSTSSAETMLPPPMISAKPKNRELPRIHNFPSAEDTTRCQAEPCASPDADSAFGDSSSTECSSGGPNRCRNSEISSSDSYRGSLNTPSPTQQISPKSNCTGNVQEDSLSLLPAADEDKAAKIRQALEKMKEAKMKKIYVKFFLEDGSTKGLLIDERWTVAETMRQLAEKLGITLTPEHVIVEEYPDLYIKRIYEDHEFVVENIEDWLADSKNKLHFVRVMDKYCFVNSPQHYLLTEKSNFDLPSADAEWNYDAKQELLKKFLRNENSAVPELEGWLLLKADGKKTWKKHYFVLRASGLYYCPKGKMRGTKDLQCLMNVYNNQIYTCTEWKKKYKAPTNWGFAIKHPKIQVKTSKYIKYVCTEDEKTWRKWVTALRITRNGCQVLYKNFVSMLDRCNLPSTSTPIRVEVPQVNPDNLSSQLTPQSTISVKSRPASESGRNSITASPARVSVLSRATIERCSPSRMVFEQDECGTIKRQPGDFSSDHSASNGTGSPLRAPSQQNPRLSSFNYADGPLNVVTTLDAQGGESDSDEEVFPPPPEVVLQRIPTPQAMHSMPTSLSNGPPPPPPQKPSSLLAFRAVPQNAEVVLRSPTSSSPMSPSHNPNLTNTIKRAPPPPPKRAETTRLTHASPRVNIQTAVQNDLYSELQRATAIQKQRIEGS